MGIGLCIVNYSLSPLIASYFNYDSYDNVVIWVTLSISLQSLLILPNALLLKGRLFYKVSFSACIAEILSLTYLLGLYFSKYTKNGLVYFGVSSIKKYLNFTLYQMSFSFINIFTRNLDTTLIGKYFDMHKLRAL